MHGGDAAGVAIRCYKVHRMAKRSKQLKTSTKMPALPVAAETEGRSLSEMAYQAILEGLFTRKVPAGAYLSQNDLVRMLGMPVQPLRDALRILETEGVLTIHPRAGIEFLKPDLELARSTYQFRTMIERTAARTYAESADAAAIEKLLKDHETLIKQITSKGLEPENLQQLEALESRLHDRVFLAIEFAVLIDNDRHAFRRAR